MEFHYETDYLLEDYDTQCRVALYSNGQTNPGIHINTEAIGLIDALDATLDIDMYVTEGDNDIYLDDPYFKSIHNFLLWIETKWKDWWGL